MMTQCADAPSAHPTAAAVAANAVAPTKTTKQHHRTDDGDWAPSRALEMTNPYPKPPYSYASLIGKAILDSKEKRARLNSIYQWIAVNYPYYQLDHGGWQNSIRHNLTVNQCFIKDPREGDPPGKGSFWTIHPEHMQFFEKGVFEKPRGKVLPLLLIHPLREKGRSLSTSDIDAARIARRRRRRSGAESEDDQSSIFSSNMDSNGFFSVFSSLLPCDTAVQPPCQVNAESPYGSELAMPESVTSTETYWAPEELQRNVLFNSLSCPEFADAYYVGGGGDFESGSNLSVFYGTDSVQEEGFGVDPAQLEANFPFPMEADVEHLVPGDWSYETWFAL